MEGKFDGMYMNHPSNKHDEWVEEKHRNREAYKMAGPILHGIVKTQLGVVEVVNALL